MGLTLGTLGIKIFDLIRSVDEIPRSVKELKKLPVNSASGVFSDASLLSIRGPFSHFGGGRDEFTHYRQGISGLINCLNLFTGNDEKILKNAIKKSCENKLAQIPPADLTMIQTKIARHFGTATGSATKSKFLSDIYDKIRTNSPYEGRTIDRLGLGGSMPESKEKRMNRLALACSACVYSLL